LRWLQSAQTQNVSAIVASTDMLAYGGLVAARAPGPSAVDAFEAPSSAGATADAPSAKRNLLRSIIGPPATYVANHLSTDQHPACPKNARLASWRFRTGDRKPAPFVERTYAATS